MPLFLRTFSFAVCAARSNGQTQTAARGMPNLSLASPDADWKKTILFFADRNRCSQKIPGLRRKFAFHIAILPVVFPSTISGSQDSCTEKPSYAPSGNAQKSSSRNAGLFFPTRIFHHTMAFAATTRITSTRKPAVTIALMLLLSIC